MHWPLTPDPWPLTSDPWPSDPQLYNQAMELCLQMFGELHILTSRLYINIGIVYEDNKVTATPQPFLRFYSYPYDFVSVSTVVVGILLSHVKSEDGQASISLMKKISYT